jgi:antitoxin component of RelBE/YafQ-DinJ toxin-antitoxin module
LHHTQSGATSQAEESRSLEENRKRAVRRLRERIALSVRLPFDLASPHPPPEFIAHRGPDGTLSVNPRNLAYPIIVAVVLDALASADRSYAAAARALGLTTSQLIRFLRADRELWRSIST